MTVWQPARVELGVRIGGFRFGGSTTGPEGLLISRKNPGSGPPYAFTTENMESTEFFIEVFSVIFVISVVFANPTSGYAPRA